VSIVPVLDVDGVEIAYEVTGQGPAVVLVSGTGQAASLWAAHVGAVSEAGFTVITFDHRGCGESAAPPGPYSVDQLADDLERLLDHLAFPSYHLVGYSLGGYVSLAVAGRRKTDITSLVLLASVGRVSVYGIAKFAVGLGRAWWSRNPGRSGQLRADLGWALSSSGALSAIDPAVRVLSVGFERDRLHPPGLVAKETSEKATAEFVEVKGCGHEAPFTQPSRVASVVVDFLCRVER
jgi:pimeloyl-ACP methyl ester carboxylesterase